MYIHLLGTKGEIEANLPYHSKQSGVLIDAQLLLDIGEKSYLDYNPKWILLTHLHPDHAYFMRRGQEKLPTRLVYAPEKSKEGLRILKRKRKLGPYYITPIPTHHSKHVKSQAYLIEKDGISILYTGDMVWIDEKYHPLFKNVTLVITDGSFIREGGMVKKDPKTHEVYGHNGIPNLIRFFQPYTKSLVFTHFGSWFYHDVKKSRKKLKALGRKYGVTIFVGYDGWSLKVC